MNDVIKGILRHLLTVAGGALASRGFTVEGSDVEVIAGSIAAVIGVVWSIWSKRTKAA